MSTKCSIRFERDEATREQVHLYQEAFDEEDHVYLSLEGFPFEAASSMNLSGQWGPRLTVRLPQAWAEKLGLLDGVLRGHTAAGLAVESGYSEPQPGEEPESGDAERIAEMADQAKDISEHFTNRFTVVKAAIPGVKATAKATPAAPAGAAEGIEEGTCG